MSQWHISADHSIFDGPNGCGGALSDNQQYFLLFFFFDLGFTAHQDYFTHFEKSQSKGGAKTGDP